MFDIETIQAMNREEAERLGTPWGKAAEHKFTPAYHGNVTYDDKLNQCHFGKRHYKAIAGVLYTFLAFHSLEDRAIVASVTEALADLFERDNPKFNREQFYELAGACSRRYALVPEVRKAVCLHDSGGRWSGSMPCTGQYKCTMCGTQLIPYTSHPI